MRCRDCDICGWDKPVDFYSIDNCDIPLCEECAKKRGL